MTLKELEIGRSARISSVGGSGALRQHFLDMGVIPKATVKVIKYAPLGDPMEIRIHGYELTLRMDDAAQIEVEPIVAVPEDEAKKTGSGIRNTPVWVREESIIKRTTTGPCLMEPFLPLPWLEIKTAARPPFLTSLPEPGSMWETSPVSLLTERTV